MQKIVTIVVFAIDSWGKAVIRVLLIEDEQVIRNGIEKHVCWGENGVDEVRSAENAEVALQICEGYTPHIIISDIRMPGMDGITFCKTISEKLPECQIIFISGFTDKEYLKAAIYLGAVSYVEKPIDLIELEAAVKKAVARVKKEEMHQELLIMTKKESEELADSIPEENEHYLIQKVKQYMQDNLQNKGLSIKMMADEVYITPTYLSSLFKKTKGVTIGQYLTELRIKRAKELLADPQWKLYQISEMVGYEDANYFGKIFKKKVGMLPSEYRDSMHSH